MSENQARHESAIRDLITVSRTSLDSQKEVTVQISAGRSQIQELRAVQPNS